jgi:hypothetical protein
LNGLKPNPIDFGMFIVISMCKNLMLSFLKISLGFLLPPDFELPPALEG